jgi:hypothetical protein
MHAGLESLAFQETLDLVYPFPFNDQIPIRWLDADSWGWP